MRSTRPGSRIVAGVQENRAEQRLQGIRENGGTAKAPGFQLAGTQLEKLAEVQPGGDLREGLAADQRGAQAR